MTTKKPTIHPYIPNSVPAVKEAMLKAVNAKSVEEFYADIPDAIRLKRRMNLPEPLLSEAALTQAGVKHEITIYPGQPHAFGTASHMH
jgi:glycine dehydrogenase subunit 1